MAPWHTALLHLPAVGTAQAEQPDVVDKLAKEDTALVVASSEGKPGVRSVEHIVVAVEVPPPLEGSMAAAVADKPRDLHWLGSFEGFVAGTAPQAEGAVPQHRAG